MIFFYHPNLNRNYILLRLKMKNSNAIRNTREYIENVWKKFSPNFPLTITFMDDWFASLYKDETKYQIKASLLRVIIPPSHNS